MRDRVSKDEKEEGCRCMRTRDADDEPDDYHGK
jgi:hypothetical protein